jgi:hypothetical protein
MLLGRFFGIFLMVLGGLFTYFYTSMVDSAGFTLKMFTAGPALIGVGIAMFIFPGGNITAAQSRAKEKEPNTFITEAPLLHKVMWGAGGVAGYFIFQAIR